MNVSELVDHTRDFVKNASALIEGMGGKTLALFERQLLFAFPRIGTAEKELARANFEKDPEKRDRAILMLADIYAGAALKVLSKEALMDCFPENIEMQRFRDSLEEHGFRCLADIFSDEITKAYLVELSDKFMEAVNSTLVSDPLLIQTFMFMQYPYEKEEIEELLDRAEVLEVKRKWSQDPVVKRELKSQEQRCYLDAADRIAEIFMKVVEMKDVAKLLPEYRKSEIRDAYEQNGVYYLAKIFAP